MNIIQLMYTFLMSILVDIKVVPSSFGLKFQSFLLASVSGCDPHMCGDFYGGIYVPGREGSFIEYETFNEISNCSSKWLYTLTCGYTHLTNTVLPKLFIFVNLIDVKCLFSLMFLIYVFIYVSLVTNKVVHVPMHFVAMHISSYVDCLCPFFLLGCLSLSY